MLERASKISPLQVKKHLPGKNCGACGTSTCMGFAVKLLGRTAKLGACPYLKQAEYIQKSLALKELLASVMQRKETQLVIHEKLCNGCGNCVVNCPPNMSCSLEASGGKGPRSGCVVLKMKNGVVEEVNLRSCRRFEEGGKADSEPCRLCIDVCPFKAIEFL
jgi:4Fe-4S ferredoxin